MPMHLHIYSHIDDAHSMFIEGLYYPHKSENYIYPYEIVITIAKAYEENGQLIPK